MQGTTVASVMMNVKVKAFPNTLFRHLILPSSQIDGDTCRSPRPDEHSERLEEQQNRECQRQSGHCQRPDSLTDKDTVDNIIKSIHHCTDHCRYRIMQQQPADLLMLQPPCYFVAIFIPFNLKQNFYFLPGKIYCHKRETLFPCP